MMSLSVDIVAIIVISTGKTADRAEKARRAWFSPTQKPSGCLHDGGGDGDHEDRKQKSDHW